MADPLLTDKRDELKGKPGVHALIVGVSEYPHLPPIESNGDPVFNMTRLASPALSAYRFHAWLTKQNDELTLVHPLKTCRVLLSPSAEERQAEPQIDAIPQVGKATFAAFAEAAKCWRKDASVESHDITIFYFCGHGLWSTATQTILALADFTEPPDTPLARCVNFDNLKKGMAPQIDLENIALTQLYFVDCCRNYPSYLSDVTEVNTGRVFDIKKNTSDQRKLSVFYSTVPGSFAASVRGHASVFCDALLHALSAAVDKERAYNDGIWAVTTDHLKRAIERYLSNQHQILEELPPEAVAARATICYMPGPPDIRLTIGVSPAVALAAGKMVLTSIDTGQNLPAAPNGGGTTLWSAAVPMGVWRLTVQPGGDTYKSFVSKPRYVDYDVTLPWNVILDAF